MGRADAGKSSARSLLPARLYLTPLRLAGLLLLGLLLMVMMFPVGLPRDYPNHLARTHIEAFIWSDPGLQRHYALSFSIIPDLAMDMVIPWLAHLIGTWKAGAVTIWLALALPPAAGLILAKLFHHRVTWLSLAGFLMVFNVSVEWGFVNYVLASGISLLGFGLWTQLRPGWRRTLIFAPFGLFLSLNHALAFLFFGFLALVWELAAFSGRERGTTPVFLQRLVAFDLPAMLPAMALILAATLGAADLPRGTADFFSLSQKVHALPASFSFFNVGLGLVIFWAVAGLAFLGVRRGYLVIERKLGIVLLAALALNILMPTSVLGIWGLHLRFWAPMVILFFASATISATAPASVLRGAGLVLAVLTSLTMMNGAWQMARFNMQAQSVRDLIGEMPEGARVLTAFDDGPLLDFAFIIHADGIAVIEKAAYVPGLFTNTSPVDVAPENVDLHMPQSLPLTSKRLAETASMPVEASTNGYWSPGFARGWPGRWDYVLYFRGEAGQRLTGLPLCATAEGPQAILYRVGAC